MMMAGAMPPPAHIVTRPTCLSGALELVEDGADEDGAGRADRVAERHGAAVDVDLVAVEVEVAHELLGHDGEGLVDLEEVDVVERHARPRSRTLRADGTGALSISVGSSPMLPLATTRARRLQAVGLARSPRWP